jgi:DNA-binding IclR family transcriptional regulator
MNATPENATKESGRYRAPALEKGLEILELMAARPEGLSQSEIARALDRTVGEIFRMLNCLVERGYLSIQRPGDRYILTLKLFELAHRSEPLDRLLGNALPAMRELAAAVEQSCHLALIEGGHGVVVAQVDNPGHIGFAVRVGSVISLASTASGRVLLAFQTPEDRQRLLAKAVAYGEPIDVAALPRDLEAIRARGFEEMDSTRIRGIRDVSFPVLDHKGSAAAAVTVPFIERIDAPNREAFGRTREALGRTVGGLTATLGGRSGVEAR